MTSCTFVNSSESSEVHLIRAIENNHVFSKGLAHVFGCFCNERNVNSVTYANGPVMICYVHVLCKFKGRDTGRQENQHRHKRGQKQSLTRRWDLEGQGMGMKS